MSTDFVLASGSSVRADLLRNACVPFRVETARIDEDALRAALELEDTSPRDMSDLLAEAKAAKVAAKNPDAMVLGCDQVLEFRGQTLTKPHDPDQAMAQLASLASQTHDLYSAAVLFDHGRPVWRHIGRVRMTMRSLSQEYIKSYVDRNWDEIRHCVGAYMLEREGARLFSGIDGDYFSVLGLPLLQLLDHLAERGVIET
ncbi:septum formation protein [Aliiruegeria haliotis]|uniref:Nucleoside triphosphate pyrophosphatase n=1 Tax=Aliiruegeria haliotis TaxID=1280846 RepID=A0A2T0RHW6_9RHOB|nr:Maf family nucleotide pyrophosphatase [Aliiruegeria haliotis]PRY20690.1 septum formation protein [Aliiruegeria haliotis]